MHEKKEEQSKKATQHQTTETIDENTEDSNQQPQKPPAATKKSERGRKKKVYPDYKIEAEGKIKEWREAIKTGILIEKDEKGNIIKEEVLDKKGKNNLSKRIAALESRVNQSKKEYMIEIQKDKVLRYVDKLKVCSKEKQELKDMIKGIMTEDNGENEQEKIDEEEPQTMSPTKQPILGRRRSSARSKK